MIKFCVKQWDKNKQRLEEHFNNLVSLSNLNYIDLVKAVVDCIFNDGSKDDSFNERFDSNRIIEIDNGDCQGTLLYLIPEDTYQPSEYEYLMTYVGYGSCSGCDTLLGIVEWDPDDRKKEAIEELMGLCLDIVQNTIKPYNTGWRNSEKYEPVEVDN